MQAIMVLKGLCICAGSTRSRSAANGDDPSDRSRLLDRGEGLVGSPFALLSFTF